MSLNDIISAALLDKLTELKVEHINAIVKASAAGFKSEALVQGLRSLKEGAVVPTPSTLGQAKPLVINAWSFCSDRGQYAETYGISTSRAGEIKDLLRLDVDKGIAEVTKIVTDHQARKGSIKPILVTRVGIPGQVAGSDPDAGAQRAGADLKAEIRRNGNIYGMHKFDAVDTGREGNLHFACNLGAGLRACFSNKAGAVSVARICRVKGRHDPLIVPYIVFWPHGKNPRVGADIPSSITYDGKLKPGEKILPEPADKAKTEAPRKASATTGDETEE